MIIEGNIIKIAGPVIVADGMRGAQMLEMVIGYRLLVIGYWLLVIEGFRDLARIAQVQHRSGRKALGHLLPAGD